ncbi:MAG: glycosyltransferase family 2 protein, partial [Crocinitomicaceae bacterium]
MSSKLSIVIPTYNEEGNITLLYDQLKEVLNAEGINKFELIYVNDGSSDKSLSVIKELSEQDARVKFISFSRNFGHQHALKAGLDHATGDAVISMDADLQHPPTLISEMLKKWKEGAQVVYTVREQEDGISWFKKKTSSGFYWLINKLSEHPIIDGAADFRLLDKKVVAEIRRYPEKELFFRGMISGIGFKQASILFKPNKRHSGQTKYSFNKMAAFAIAGITSSSAKPLYFSIYLGAFMAFLAFLYGIYAICIALFTNDAITGWTSIVASIVFIGGIQLFVMGIIGVYLGKIFKESKNRPH